MRAQSFRSREPMFDDVIAGHPDPVYQRVAPHEAVEKVVGRSLTWHRSSAKTAESSPANGGANRSANQRARGRVMRHGDAYVEERLPVKVSQDLDRVLVPFQRRR